MKIETTRKMKNFKYVLMVFAGGGMPEFSAKGLVLAFTVFGTTHSIALFSAGIPRIGAAVVLYAARFWAKGWRHSKLRESPQCFSESPS